MDPTEELKAQVSRLERKINFLGDVVILGASGGLGISVGYLIQNWSNIEGWGWAASIGTGLTIGIVGYLLRSEFR